MRILNNSLRGLAILAAFAWGSTVPAEEEAKPLPTVTAHELKERLALEQPPLLLDVRSEKEFGTGHVPDAENIPVDQLPDRLAELAEYKERGVILYCQTGRRVQIAAKTLTDAGFEDVTMLEGNMQAWEERELPIERGKPDSKDK
jgi:rhodanese-related sulfurtransferase